MTIDEMKLVDSTRAQLEQLAVQVANREAQMKRDAATAGLVQFKTYFANRDFALTGNDWGVSAAHGSINFSIAVKNAQTGGIECLILKFPEMIKRPPLPIFFEEQVTTSTESAPTAVDGNKSLLAEIQEKALKMRELLSAPPKKWLYYALLEIPGTAARRKDYSSFRRLLEEECP